MSEPSPELVGPTELGQYQSGDPALLLAYAEGLVRGYCGWHIAPSRAEDLTVAGEGTSELLLPTLYLTELVAITNDGEAVDLADVNWWVNGRVSWRCGCWTYARNAVATVEHGYPTTPYDLRAVVSSIANRVSLGGDGIRSEAAGSLSITYTEGGASSFSADELRVLDRYRIWNRP